jgi:hypothetical protein
VVVERDVPELVEHRLEVEDQPGDVQRAPGQVLGAELVPRIRGDLERHARVVGEVDPDRREDGDGGDDEQQRRATASAVPGSPPLRAGRAHGQKSSGRMMAIRVCAS